MESRFRNYAGHMGWDEQRFIPTPIVKTIKQLKMRDCPKFCVHFKRGIRFYPQI